MNVNAVVDSDSKNQALPGSVHDAYRYVLQQHPIILFRWLPDGTILSANRPFTHPAANQTGNRQKTNLLNYMAAEDSARLCILAQSLTPEHSFFSCEHAVNLEKGKSYWKHSAEGIFDEQGTLLEIRSAVSDISEQVKTQKALLESELRHRTLLQALPDLMFIVDRDKIYLDYHATDPEDLTVAPEDVIGKSLYELLPPETAQVIEAAYDSAFQSGKMTIVDYPLQIGGENKFFKAYIVPYGEDKLLSIIRNVTEIRTTLERLQQTEQRYHSIFEGVRDGILVEDNDGHIIDTNQAACQIFGFTREELLQKSVYDIADPEHVIVVEKDMKTLIDKIPKHAIEVVNIRSNGERFPAEITARLHPIGDNMATVVVVRDISERKKQQEELLRLSTAMQITSDALVITDGKGNIVEVNDALLQLVGADSAAEVIGIPVFRLIPLKDRKAAIQSLTRIEQPQDVRYSEVDILTLQDETVPVEVSIALMETAGEKTSGYVLMLRDITQRRKTENQLRHLASVDVLTGVSNRFSFEEEITRLSHSSRFPICLIMLDTDGLKHINDTLGHSKGDELLTIVADILRISFRETDFVARIGGDEFVVIMTRSDEEAMQQAIDRLRLNIEIADRQHPEFRVSVSIGGVCATRKASLHKALYVADERMYREKENKRRR